MTGSGPAGELVYPDVKARLRAVLAHIAAAEADHEHVAVEVAAAREPVEPTTEAEPEG